MTDTAARPPRRPAGPAADNRKPHAAAKAAAGATPGASRFELAAAGLRLIEQVLTGGAHWLGQSVERSLERGLDLARNPETVNEYARHALGIAAEVARVATLPDDIATRLKGPLGRSKRVAWAQPLPFDEVRTVARTLGVTINDVLISAVAGALGSYLRDAGEQISGLSIRAAVPVNLRHPEATLDLGNHFGLVFLELPVGITHPLERLYAVHAAMRALKDSYQPVMMLGLLAALGRMPGAVEHAAIDLLGTKISAVVSNVPGPKEPLYFAGQRIVQQMFWVPQAGGIGVGISVLTYAGQVQFGLMVDRKRIPDPNAVVRRFGEQFEQLLLTTLMGPALLSRAGPSILGGSA